MEGERQAHPLGACDIGASWDSEAHAPGLDTADQSPVFSSCCLLWPLWQASEMLVASCSAQCASCHPILEKHRVKGEGVALGVPGHRKVSLLPFFSADLFALCLLFSVPPWECVLFKVETKVFRKITSSPAGCMSSLYPVSGVPAHLLTLFFCLQGCLCIWSQQLLSTSSQGPAAEKLPSGHETCCKPSGETTNRQLGWFRRTDHYQTPW